MRVVVAVTGDPGSLVGEGEAEAREACAGGAEAAGAAGFDFVRRDFLWCDEGGWAVTVCDELTVAGSCWAWSSASCVGGNQKSRSW